MAIAKVHSTTWCAKQGVLTRALFRTPRAELCSALCSVLGWQGVHLASNSEPEALSPFFRLSVSLCLDLTPAGGCPRGESRPRGMNMFRLDQTEHAHVAMAGQTTPSIPELADGLSVSIAVHLSAPISSSRAVFRPEADFLGTYTHHVNPSRPQTTRSELFTLFSRTAISPDNSTHLHSCHGKSPFLKHG